jgi:DNA-binding NarL/FixJ family response regulator
MNKQIIVVIATRSIPLADGLEALLKAIPEIDNVEIVRTMEHVVKRVEDIRPRILLLDRSLASEKPEEFLEKIIVLSPKTLRVLLVDDAQDSKWQPQFAEAILIKGAAPIVVVATLTNLLFEKGDNNEKTYW